MVRQPRIEFAEACHHALSRTASYTYDGNNRLLSAAVGTNSATFTHDARMRNIKRVVDGQMRYFYFDGWSLVQERDGSGNVVQNYVNGPRIDDHRSLGRLGGEPAIAGPGRARLGRSRASQIVRKTDSSDTVYYHADALGSVVALTDDTGDVVERYTYDVFGAPTIFDSSFTILTSSQQSNRFLFTGREWIERLELYDCRNRIYSPSLGRFLQTDPIRFRAGDANLYRYVSNDPILGHDPFGLFFKDVLDELKNYLKSCDQLKNEYNSGSQGLEKVNKEIGDALKALDKLVKDLKSCKDGCENLCPSKIEECKKKCHSRFDPQISDKSDQWKQLSDEAYSLLEEIANLQRHMDTRGCDWKVLRSSYENTKHSYFFYNLFFMPFRLRQFS